MKELIHLTVKRIVKALGAEIPVKLKPGGLGGSDIAAVNPAVWRHFVRLFHGV